MKQVRMAVVAFCLAVASVQGVQAQSLGNLLKGVATSGSGSGSAAKNVVTSLLDGLIGTAAVSPATLAGTWTYEKPAVAFESESLLKQAGSSVVAGTIETKLQAYLSKIGFTANNASFVFTEDGAFTLNLKGKAISGTYAVNGSTLTLQRTGLLKAHSITSNVKVSGSEMQVTFKADKLLNFITDFAGSSSISSLQTVAKLANGIDGMQLGFKFNK